MKTLFTLFLAATLFTSCASSRETAGTATIPFPTDSVYATAPAPTLTDLVAPAPVTATPPVAAPAPLTPKQARQYRKNLKAQAKTTATVAKAQKPATPLFQGKGAINAPNAAGNVVGGNKPGNVVAADSGSIVDQGQATVATNIKGDNNKVKADAQVEEAPGTGAQLVKSLAGPVGIVIGVVLLVVIGYFILRAYLIRKALP